MRDVAIVETSPRLRHPSPTGGGPSATGAPLGFPSLLWERAGAQGAYPGREPDRGTGSRKRSEISPAATATLEGGERGLERSHLAVRWRAIGASVRGAAHGRTGLPNPDAIAWAAADGRGARPGSATDEDSGSAALVLTVSDGHGSAKCFRSASGARFAVEAALDVVNRLLASPPDVTDLAALQAATEAMVWRWKAAVAADVCAHPLTEAELDTVERKDGPGARRAVECNPGLAYGATLLAALATDAYLVYFQLGDGDILAVADDGEVVRPLADDPRLFADATTSLCARDAARQFRVGLQRLGDGAPPPPALIVLATDGYANSFRTDAGFVKVGADLLETVRREGLEAVDACLASWLHEASEFGSGDDVTVGIVCRADVAPSGAAAPVGIALELAPVPDLLAEDLP